MRHPLAYAIASCAALGILTAAGCASDDDEAARPGEPDAERPPPQQTFDAAVEDAPKQRPEAGPHEPGWDPGFSLPGVAGRVNPTVNAIARVAHRQIALAGNFEQAGSIPTKFVALWNGDKWLSIASGLTESIDKLVATPTGELFGTVIVEGGSKLFRWNKIIWSEIATFEGRIESLDVAPDGTLYAAGGFTKIDAHSVANVAKLVGNTWSAVQGAPEGAEIVRVLGARICVSGKLDPWSGSGPVVGVKCLEGGEWHDKPFGPDVFGRVRDIGEQAGDLVIAGPFRIGAGAASLARWNGASWQVIGGGLSGVGGADVKDMEIDGSRIYVTGDIQFAGGQQVNYVAMWDTTTSRWSSLNDGILGNSGGVAIEPPGMALALDQGGELYVGGRFSLIGGRNALGVARWDGNQWHPVDEPTARRLGANGSVTSFAYGPDGELYVGGAFYSLGGDVATAHVGRFDDDGWSPLGVGLDGAVLTLAVSGKTLYAGGSFLRSGSAITRGVAQWDGVKWSGLGSGLRGTVATLVFGPDGKLYAGGDFTEAGSVIVDHVARWDGATWQALGAGFDGSVQALAFDGAGKLYAGGNFTTSGTTPVRSIAVWDGASWSALGDGVDGAVSRIAVYDGKVTIAGGFARSGSATLDNVAAWDGNAWIPVGGGVRHEGGSAFVAGMSVRGSELYLSGLFRQTGAVDAPGPSAVNGLAMWNGNRWTGFGDGLSDEGTTILADKDGFWIGGSFTFAGNQGSYNIGRFWFDP